MALDLAALRDRMDKLRAMLPDHSASLALKILGDFAVPELLTRLENHAELLRVERALYEPAMAQLRAVCEALIVERAAWKDRATMTDEQFRAAQDCVRATDAALRAAGYDPSGQTRKP